MNSFGGFVIIFTALASALVLITLIGFAQLLVWFVTTPLIALGNLILWFQRARKAP